MVKEQQELSARNDSKPSVISLTPAQMEQFHAAMAFFDHFRDLMQPAKANTPPSSTPTDTQAPFAKNLPLQAKAAASALDASESQSSISSSRATFSSSKATLGSSPRVQDVTSPSTAVGNSSTAASTSSNASQGPSSKPQVANPPRTRYEYGRTDTGGNCIRHYRKRPAPYDPAKDPQMICHTAAHRVCRKIMQGMGFQGEW